MSSREPSSTAGRSMPQVIRRQAVQATGYSRARFSQADCSLRQAIRRDRLQALADSFFRGTTRRIAFIRQVVQNDRLLADMLLAGGLSARRLFTATGYSRTRFSQRRQFKATGCSQGGSSKEGWLKIFFRRQARPSDRFPHLDLAYPVALLALLQLGGHASNTRLGPPVFLDRLVQQFLESEGEHNSTRALVT